MTHCVEDARITHVAKHEYYSLRGGMLFFTRRGTEYRVLDFCLDDPEQDDVLILPIMPVVGKQCGDSWDGNRCRRPLGHTGNHPMTGRLRDY